MTPRISSLAQIATRSANGQMMAVRQKQEAIDRYQSAPKHCRHCGKILILRDGQKPSDIRLRSFCDRSCAAKHNNQGINRSARLKKAPSSYTCRQCGLVFSSRSRTPKFCSRSCATRYQAKQAGPEELLRRGFGDSKKSSRLRKRQILWEESIAEDMRSDGWEIFSPTVVCDRVGVKNGFVYFIEFKPESNQKLRAGQKRIAELVPGMYKIVVK